MQIQTMEASLSNELLEGEEVLWSGRPDPRRRRIVSPARVFLILGLVFLPIGLVLGIIGLVLGIIGLTLLLSSGFRPGSLGLFIPGSVFFLLGLIYLLIGLVGSFPSRNTLYAITNHRVIIERSGRNTHVSSYPKRAITQVQHIERPDGSGDLIFVATPAYGSTGRVGAFSALPNVRLVEQKLIRMLNEE